AGYSMGEAAVDQGRVVVPTMSKTIPFDYVFQFPLTGTPSNRVQDVVEISMQGVFVAVSIGYSFVLDERKTPRAFPPAQEPTQLEPIAIPFDGSNIVVFSGMTGPVPGILIIGSPGDEVTVLHLDPNSPAERLVFNQSPPGSQFQDITLPLNAVDTDRVTLGADGTASVD